MERVIKFRDQSVAVCLVTLALVAGFFVYRSAVYRNELKKVREQNRLVSRQVKSLEERFNSIRTYTRNAEGFASAASYPGALQDQAAIPAGSTDRDRNFWTMLSGVKNRALGLESVEERKQGDLERFLSTMMAIDGVSRDTDLVLRRLRSLATLFKYNSDMMKSIPSVRPTEGNITSEFGTRMSPFEGKRHFHPGLDIAAPLGTPVIAPADGTVTFVGDFENLGKSVLIDHGSGILTRYGHLSRYSVREGQTVRRGDVVAQVGNTGRSTGSHLHYEIWVKNVAVNPRDFFFDLEPKRDEDLVAKSVEPKKRKIPTILEGMGGED